MKFKRISVSKRNKSRIWGTLFLLALIPSILLSIYGSFFAIPNQTLSAEQQEVVSQILADSAQYGDALGKVTVNFERFTGRVVIQNGGFSFPEATIPSRIVNFFLFSVVFYMLAAVALGILYGVSCSVFRYEE